MDCFLQLYTGLQMRINVIEYKCHHNSQTHSSIDNNNTYLNNATKIEQQ